VSQLSRFGDLGDWRQLDRNRLTTPRAGATAVTVPGTGDRSYVYVIGGIGTGAALASVERAVVLSTADAPIITRATPMTVAGGLDSGTWYYKVAAVLAAGDPDNPGGETLASDEEIVTLGARGGITLEWSAVTVNGAAAVGYRIYRTDEVNGRSQTEHLIGTTTGTTFVDDGKAAGTESFLPDGALGKWKVVTAALGTGRWGHQALVAADPAGASHVVVMGGKSARMGGVLASVEHAPLDAAGAMGSFADGTAMPAPRAFFSAALATRANSKLGPQTPSRIWVTAGINGASMTVDSVLYTDVVNGGGNGAWTTIGKSTNSRVGGVMSVITRNALFALGGAGTVTDGASGPTFGAVTLAGRQMILDNAGGEGTSISSTSNGLLSPRAFGVTVQNAGLIYFIGGTSDGANALGTTEITF
jgi:hypothetical protein